MATNTQLLPSREELELADYKSGSLISDLEHMASRLQRLLAVDSLEEGLRREAAGEEPAETPRLDPDQLARIVVFATEILCDDVRLVAEHATEIQTAARHLLRNEQDLRAFESGQHREGRGRLAAWHRAQAELDERAAEGGEA
jgi:hypothetical protein